MDTNTVSTRKEYSVKFKDSDLAEASPEEDFCAVSAAANSHGSLQQASSDLINSPKTLEPEYSSGTTGGSPEQYSRGKAFYIAFRRTISHPSLIEYPDEAAQVSLIEDGNVVLSPKK
ncbi:hypothetical protein C8J56DRAFT_1065206 [Mycena floridula]|nr:hypothetical protein C8J56DRAFT_1065206 [Mycena floridula]